ncbi:precorrin-6x reductase [Methanococcus vannielii SB]|uniref:Precorrin-6x reductase n=1 Tax=Methanococcus vannielii (strain ATCC 35089 / DSM 1224 / JCM 13029 / OCM 148 / SB) TaxID=406327 RepID=A6US93_METVS|nr:precorrin-6A reductase [Methanococcus vannielii]ABR55365.1 precorrin-6x reductase [Methanococcus vannielii SB]
MKIWIRGGTSDAEKISKEIKRNFKNVFLIVTTTTELGGEIAKSYADYVISEKMTRENLKKMLVENEISIFLDATHPFSVNASETGINVSKELNIPYIRYERPVETFENAYYVDSFEKASKLALSISKKNIFYMAGIKNLESISKLIPLERLIVRILPVSIIDALKIVPSKNIVAMQGVFSKELNYNLIKDYNCDVIITKDSGKTGGIYEKVSGALLAGAIPIIVNRPKIDYPLKFEKVEDLINYLKKFN